MSDHRTKDWCEKHNWCFRHKSPRTQFWCPDCIDEYETRVAKLEESERELLLLLSGQDDRFDRSPELQALLKKCKIKTDPCTLMVRVAALEAALAQAKALLGNLPDGDNPREWREWHEHYKSFLKAAP